MIAGPIGADTPQRGVEPAPWTAQVCNPSPIGRPGRLEVVVWARRQNLLVSGLSVIGKASEGVLTRIVVLPREGDSAPIRGPRDVVRAQGGLHDGIDAWRVDGGLENAKPIVEGKVVMVLLRRRSGIMGAPQQQASRPEQPPPVDWELHVTVHLLFSV